jgi:cytochrome c5
MKMTWKHCLLLAAFTLVLSFAFEVTAQQSDAPGTTPAKTAATTGQPPSHQDEGQRVFEQNCSRCHTAPSSFSPRISGTIVRHMRVRASLSRHDEKALLQFFNP